MNKFVSIIMIVMLSLSFMGTHDYNDSDVQDSHSITATHFTGDISIQQQGGFQEDTSDLLHKHCSMSCFIIPTDQSVVEFSFRKNKFVNNFKYFELSLANRLKRPPRQFV